MSSDPKENHLPAEKVTRVYRSGFLIRIDRWFVFTAPSFISAEAYNDDDGDWILEIALHGKAESVEVICESEKDSLSALDQLVAAVNEAQHTDSM